MRGRAAASAACEIHALGEPTISSKIVVLLFSDIVGSVNLKTRLGDAGAAKLVGRHDAIFRETFRAELEQHMYKEERVLFPAICEIESASEAPRRHCGSINNPISVMQHEHDNAGAALRKMRALTYGYALPENACNTYRALFAGLAELEQDMHTHVHKENNILFPRAAQREAQLGVHA